MVCLGNICRSPIAEGILRKKIEEHKLNVLVDSAGTGDWHVGQGPDKRAIETAQKFGVDISTLRGRQISPNDFDTFDKIFVMDKHNYGDVVSLTRKNEHKEKVELLLNTVKPGSNHSVPDPYYGEVDGFHDVFRMIDTACDAIVTDLKKKVESEKV